MLYRTGLLVMLVLLSAPVFALDIDISDATTPDESAVSQTVAVFISSSHNAPITVNYTITNDTATEGLDYTDNTTGSLTFGAGETVKSISIPIIDDVLDEETERFYVNLTSTSFGTIATSQASVYITDDDNPPSIVINDNTTADETAGNTNLTVSLSAPSSKPITVNYTTLDATATAGQDYTTNTGTISFNPGDNSTLIPIAILGDGIDEENEQLYVNLSNPTNATIADSQGALTITDDDNPPDLSVADVTSSDENSVDVIVSLNNASGKAVSVNIATSAGTALAGADFNAFTSTVNFTAGETSKTVTIPLINDSFDEDDETFTVTLSGPTNANIATATATVTIADDDTAPTLSISDQTVAEHAGSMTTNVTLSAASGKTITVNYLSADTSATAGNDYLAISSTPLTFAPGQTTQSISTTINEDVVDEEDEEFEIRLSSPVNATIADGTAVIQITDNDAPPTISLSDATSTDESAVSTNLVASLSAASERTISVNFATANDTASVVADYQSNSGVLTFIPGETSKNIPVTVVHDSLNEDDETVDVILSSPSNVTLADAVGVLTIVDDDPLPSLTIADFVTTDETGMTRLMTVTLSDPSGRPVSVDYSTADGTATANNDYVPISNALYFNPGETTQTLGVTIYQDLLD